MSKYLIEKGAEITTSTIYEKCISTLDKKVVSINAVSSSTYKIKIKLNGRFVEYITDDISSEENIYNELVSYANIIENNEESKFATDEIASRSDIVEELKDENVIKLINSLYSLKKDYENLKTLRIDYNYIKNNYKIENSAITSIDNNSCYVFCIEAIFKRDDKIVCNYEYFYEHSIDESKLKEKLKTLLTESNDQLFTKSASKPSSNKVLIRSKAVSKIMCELMWIYHAEGIKNSLSPLVNKLHEKVFSELITIVEDPFGEDTISKRAFDNEGTPKEKQTIVEKGVFLKMMQDNKTADFYNEKSTGNSKTLRNLYIIPGVNDIEDNFDKGIIITNVEGTHSGISDITGNISVQGKGYIVENNKKIPVNNLILTTTLEELLSSVVEVDKDLKVYNASISMPSLLVENINVTIED